MRHTLPPWPGPSSRPGRAWSSGHNDDNTRLAEKCKIVRLARPRPTGLRFGAKNMSRSRRMRTCLLWLSGWSWSCGPPAFSSSQPRSEPSSGRLASPNGALRFRRRVGARTSPRDPPSAREAGVLVVNEVREEGAHGQQASSNAVRVQPRTCNNMNGWCLISCGGLQGVAPFAAPASYCPGMLTTK